MKYILITVDDAQVLYRGLRRELVPVSKDDHERLLLLEKRFQEDTGGDFEQIATWLKKLSFCFACVNEGQEDSCRSLGARKLGRRLFRLIQRARGEVPEEDSTLGNSTSESTGKDP